MAESLRMARRIAANTPLVLPRVKESCFARRNFGSDRSHAMWEMNNDELKPTVAASDAAERTTAFAKETAACLGGPHIAALIKIGVDQLRTAAAALMQPRASVVVAVRNANNVVNMKRFWVVVG